MTQTLEITAISPYILPTYSGLVHTPSTGSINSRPMSVSCKVYEQKGRRSKRITRVVLLAYDDNTIYTFADNKAYTVNNVITNRRTVVEPQDDDNAVEPTFLPTVDAKKKQLYVAAFNSRALGVSNWMHMSHDSLIAALAYMVVTPNSVRNRNAVSSNKIWKYKTDKSFVNTATIVAGTNWHKVPNPTTVVLHLAEQYSVLEGGFYNQYNYLTNLPDMPKQNALASYPGTMVHIALAHFATPKPAPLNTTALEHYNQMQKLLNNNDPLLGALGEAIADNLFHTTKATSTDRRVIVPFVSWGGCVPLIYPDVETNTCVYELKTQWADEDGVPEARAENVNQAMLQAASVFITGNGTAHTTSHSKLAVVAIPNNDGYVHEVRQSTFTWAIDKEMVDCIFRQHLARLMCYDKGSDPWYCDTHCCFPLGSVLGELLLRGTDPWYIVHADQLVTKTYKYIPAFWNDSASAVQLQVSDMPDPIPLKITVNDDGGLLSIENKDYTLRECLPKVQQVFDAFRKTAIFAWFDPFTDTTNVIPRVETAPRFTVHQKVRAVFRKKTYEAEIVHVSYAETPSRDDFVDVWFLTDDSVCAYNRSEFKHLTVVSVPPDSTTSVKTTRRTLRSRATSFMTDRKYFRFQMHDVVNAPYAVSRSITRSRTNQTTKKFPAIVIKGPISIKLDTIDPQDYIEVQFTEDDITRKFIRKQWHTIDMVEEADAGAGV